HAEPAPAANGRGRRHDLLDGTAGQLPQLDVLRHEGELGGLQVTPDRVKEAVAAGEYHLAASMFGELVLDARPEDLETLTALVEWSRKTVQCARSHEWSRLHSLRGQVRVLEAYSQR